MTITEYVDVAKAFYPDGKEAKFVNGVLDHMARAARPRPSADDAARPIQGWPGGTGGWTGRPVAGSHA